jgi:hypothetical protein
MTLLMLSMPVRSMCQMNRRIVGTAVGGRSILCVVLIISYHKPVGQPTHSTHRNHVCQRYSVLGVDMVTIPQGLAIPSSTLQAPAEVYSLRSIQFVPFACGRIHRSLLEKNIVTSTSRSVTLTCGQVDHRHRAQWSVSARHTPPLQS